MAGACQSPVSQVFPRVTDGGGSLYLARRPARAFARWWFRWSSRRDDSRRPQGSVCQSRYLVGAMHASAEREQPSRTAMLRRGGAIGAMSGVLVVLLATVAAAAPVTHDALATRSRASVLPHDQHRDLHQGAGRVHRAIVGGRGAPAGSFPWLAFIEDNLGGGNYDLCTGTLVSSNVVLTAGHCVEDVTTETQDPASGFAVVTGALDWTDRATRQVSGVSQTAIYPGFDPSTAHGDAAVLELSTPTTAPALPLATTSSFFCQAAQMRWLAGV